MKESKKRHKYHNLARELKNLWNMKLMSITIIIGALSSHQKIGTRTGGLGNNGMGGDCSNYSIVEISQNIEKSPGNLRRLPVTQTPVKNNQLTLMRKTLKE